MNHVAAAGLIFDISGVVLLAWALVRVPAAQVRAQAALFWGANRNLARAIIEQQTDAYAGLPCLVIGFTMQFFGTVGWLWPTSPVWWLSIVLLILALLTYAIWLRRVRIELQMREIEAQETKGEVTQSDAILQAQVFGRR